MSKEQERKWWTRNIRALIKIVNLCSSNLEEAKAVFKEANIWATKYGLKSYTLNMIISKYDKLKLSSEYRTETERLEEYKKKKRMSMKDVKTAINILGINELEGKKL